MLKQHSLSYGEHSGWQKVSCQTSVISALQVDTADLTAQPTAISVSSCQFEGDAEFVDSQPAHTAEASLEAGAAADIQPMQVDAVEGSRIGDTAGLKVLQPEAESVLVLGQADLAADQQQQDQQQQEQPSGQQQSHTQVADAPNSILQAPSQTQQLAVSHVQLDSLLSDPAEQHQQHLLGSWPIPEPKHAAAPAGPTEDDTNIMSMATSEFPLPTPLQLPFHAQQEPPAGSQWLQSWPVQAALQQGLLEQQLLGPQPAGMHLQPAEVQLQASPDDRHTGRSSQQSAQQDPYASAHPPASQDVDSFVGDDSLAQALSSGQIGLDTSQVGDLRQPENLSGSGNAEDAPVQMPLLGREEEQNGWHIAAGNEDGQFDFAVKTTAEMLDPLLEFGDIDCIASPEQNGTGSLIGYKRALDSGKEGSDGLPDKKQCTTLESFA